MNQRIKWIDFVKGFLILTVMLGYTLGCPNIIKVYIYSFHMPLFFILSGYTLSIEKYLFSSFLPIIYIVNGILLIIPIIDFLNFLKSNKLKGKRIQTTNSYIGSIEN